MFWTLFKSLLCTFWISMKSEGPGRVRGVLPAER